MMRKIKVLMFILIGAFTMVACGMEAPPSVAEIEKNSIVNSYFDFLEMDVKSISLDRRQTYEEQKIDYAYCNISAENEQAYINEMFIIKSVYYDKGGWQIEAIEANEGEVSYIPKEPNIEEYSNGYEIIDKFYESGSNVCTVKYNKVMDYKIGSVYETIENDFYFYEGKWNIDFSDYKKKNIVSRREILKDDYITGKWGDEILDGFISIDILCINGYLNINSIDEDGYKITCDDSMKNISYVDDCKWIGSDIGFGWRVDNVKYVITQGMFDGHSNYTDVILKPDIENDIIWIYIRYNKYSLKKID